MKDRGQQGLQPFLKCRTWQKQQQLTEPAAAAVPDLQMAPLVKAAEAATKTPETKGIMEGPQAKEINSAADTGAAKTVKEAAVGQTGKHKCHGQLGEHLPYSTEDIPFRTAPVSTLFQGTDGQNWHQGTSTSGLWTGTIQVSISPLQGTSTVDRH